jgi:hypothetical protein
VPEKSSGPWRPFCIPQYKKSVPVPGARPLTFSMPEKSGPWSKPFSGIGECTLYNLKCLIPVTLRLFRPCECQNVPFQEQEKCSGMRECLKKLCGWRERCSCFNSRLGIAFFNRKRQKIVFCYSASKQMVPSRSFFAFKDIE